jgi:uncharacterized membrane protein YsdA (DUF1294 family)
MSKRKPKTTFSVIALVLSLLVLVAVLYFLKLDLFWAWLLAWSLVAFGLYGYDKAQAKIGGGRVPEIVLHIVTLIGGWPGAWIGRFVFRHKIRKPVFLTVLIISTLLWIGIGYWYLIVLK